MLLTSHTSQNYCERILFEKDKNQPLFLYKNGTVLTRHILMKNIELYLSLIGLDSKQYSVHSYRIGGATTMAALACQTGK